MEDHSHVREIYYPFIHGELMGLMGLVVNGLEGRQERYLAGMKQLCDAGVKRIEM